MSDAEEDPKPSSQVSWVDNSLVSGGLCKIKFIVEAVQNFQICRFTFNCFLDD